MLQEAEICLSGAAARSDFGASEVRSNVGPMKQLQLMATNEYSVSVSEQKKIPYKFQNKKDNF